MLSDHQKAAQERLDGYAVQQVGLVDERGRVAMQYKHLCSGETFTIVQSNEPGTAPWKNAFDRVRRRRRRPPPRTRCASRRPPARRARPRASSLSMTAPRSSPPMRRR